MAAYTLTLSISSDSPAEMASTVDALKKSLSSLDTGHVAAAISLPRRPTAGAVEDPTAWYSQHASSFLNELTPDAVRAVLFVAEHAPAVSIETLSSELKLGKGPALAGKLASIGWAVRRLSAPAPFRRVRDRYEIEPEVAAALLGVRPRAAAGASASPAGARGRRQERNSAASSPVLEPDGTPVGSRPVTPPRIRRR